MSYVTDFESVITLDFETYPIEPGTPAPLPVGLAVKYGNQPGYYVTTMQEMAAELVKAKASGRPVLFHNCAFDEGVAARFFGVTFDEELVHDSLFLLFLTDPRAKRFNLKVAAQHFLGEPPSERDDLDDWIVANIDGATKKNAGKWIAYAPPSLVRPYAIGDVDRTKGLFDLLYRHVIDRDMHEAYRLEIKLAREVTRDMEAEGVRIDVDSLLNDKTQYEREIIALGDAVRQRLGRSNLNLRSDTQLTDALLSAGVTCPVSQWPRTDKGNLRTDKDTIQLVIADPMLKETLARYLTLEYMMSGFLRPWYDDELDERLYPSWNQVAGYHGSDHGTRSGRYSSSGPNFQNMNRKPDDPTMPYMRRYILPEEGHVLIGRDFCQQEIRIMAHYENGGLAQSFIANPRLDPHQKVSDNVYELSGVRYQRPAVKIMHWILIYGGGTSKLASNLGVPYADAKQFKRLYYKAHPDVRTLMKRIKERAYERGGGEVRTRGGRIYRAEAGREYALPNWLIQGSAADHTKRAMLRAKEMLAPFDGKLRLTVHDEILASVPRESAKEADAALAEAMEWPYFDVPTPTDGAIGDRWSDLKE